MTIPDRLRLALLLGTLLALLSGCTLTRYTDTKGGSFTRISVGTTQNIGPIDVSAGPTETKVRIEGYSSEQAQIASAVVGAALKATGGGAR